MAIRAIFVGINKHFDVVIPEQSGAQQDGVVSDVHRHERRFCDAALGR